MEEQKQLTKQAFLGTLLRLGLYAASIGIPTYFGYKIYKQQQEEAKSNLFKQLLPLAIPAVVMYWLHKKIEQRNKEIEQYNKQMKNKNKERVEIQSNKKTSILKPSVVIIEE